MDSRQHLKCGIACSVAMGLVVIMSFAVPCSAAQDPSLVAHYTFDEGPGSAVKDSSGNDNHGKIFDDVQYVKDEQGKGYFLQFNSGKAYVDCGKRPSLDLTDAVSLELWFYPETDVAKGEGGVVGKIMGSYCMSYSSKCWFYAPNSSNYVASDPLSRGWHHLVATFDGAEIKMYVDGKLRQTRKSQLAKLPHGQNFYLRYPATYQNVEPEYKCKMDDVRVYSRALTKTEVAQHYRVQAKTGGKHDMNWFDKAKLALYAFPQAQALTVEANVGDMDLGSAGARLELALRTAEGVKSVATREIELAGKHATAGKDAVIRFEFDQLAEPGVSHWAIDVGGFPAGRYEVVAKVTDGNGDPIGEPSSVALSLPLEKPDWIKAYDGTRVLNNLVAELLRVETPQAGAEKEYTFTNPRDGWVFLSCTAAAGAATGVNVFIDAEIEAAIALNADAGKRTGEAMRHLPAGSHKVIVRCEGDARPTALVVRSIPELIVAGMGYPRAPLLPCFGYYNMEYLQRIGLLDNLNVLSERAVIPENAPYIEAWRAQGKKYITRYGMWAIWQSTPTADSIFRDWTGDRGLLSPDYDGLIADEFSGVGHGGAEKYPLYTEAIRRIGADPRFQGKVFYPYCVPMYPSDFGLNMLRAVIDSGYKWAEEQYMVEQSTEALADEYMDLRFRRNLLRYIRTFPDAAAHVIYTLGFMSAPPSTFNVDPQVDFKVYMDMQMHLLATDPLFFGLYGVHWYHNGYVDEEDLRWAAKLFRHYCIEGRTERLSSDPYILTHIQNPDFDAGAAGWTLAPAEPDSISAQEAEGLGVLETRVRRGNDTAGDRFLVMRRSAEGPNRFSQKIVNLTAGRQYSVKMITGDYDEMTAGKSTPFQTHPVSITIDGADPIPEKEFHQLFASSRGNHVFGPFTGGANSFYMTYHRVVFRATSAEARLIVSDWASPDAPGGRIGQQMMHNFIEVQPYLEDPDYVAPAYFRDDYVMVLYRRERDADGEGPTGIPDAVPLVRYTFDEGQGTVARNAVAGAPDAEIHGAEHVQIGDGHVLRFDGQDDHVRVKDGGALNISGTSLSIACWFRVNDADAHAAALCGNYQDGVGGYMLMYAPEGVTFRNGASRSAAGHNAKAADGKWHYAVGVMEDGVMMLYLDGEYVPGIGVEEIVRPSPAPFVIGRSGSDRSFSGEIDEVAVYDKALSVTEIRKHFEEGARY